MKLLVLGASGMLGHVLLRELACAPGIEAIGTVRDPAALARLPEGLRGCVRVGGDLTDPGVLEALLDADAPEVIGNAVGVLKQVSDSQAQIATNALLPHRLASAAAVRGARLIHVSTDCVFSGACGGYREADAPDAYDIYGRAKALGEPPAPALTLRTSLIGPELGAARGLLGWFLAQSGPVPGYARAVFSGLPTIVFARFLRDHILPRPDLTGVWHLSADPISKLDLLRLVATRWPHPIPILPAETPVLDRSLDSSRLRALTGWVPPSWPEMIDEMRASA